MFLSSPVGVYFENTGTLFQGVHDNSGHLAANKGGEAWQATTTTTTTTTTATTTATME